MKKFLPFLLLLLLVAAAFTGWSLLGGGDDSDRRALAPGDLSDPVVAATDTPASLVAPKTAPEARTEVTTPAPTASAAQETVQNPGPSAIWVEGRVVIPPDTPLDEIAFVIAKGKRLGGKKSDREYRTLVGQDGRFRVAFGKGTKNARVYLEARYLKLEDNKKFTPRADEELLLEPILGGRILVQFERADGAAWTEEDTEGLELDVRDTTLDFWQNLKGRRVRSADGSEALDLFEFGGAKPGANHDLSTTSPLFVSEDLDKVVVLAGETEEVELSLRVGARLKGRVVDHDGKGIGNAQIRANSKSTEYGSVKFINSDEDGVFDQGGLEPAETKLIVTSSGFVDEEMELGMLALGQVVDELVIELGRGHSISGRVLWPDGSAVSEASVRMEKLDSESSWWDGDSNLVAETDVAGNFEVTGLVGDEVYRVFTRARRTKEIDVEGLSKLKRKRALKAAPFWNAEINEVRSGATEVVLTLRSGASFVGTVVDDTGAALNDFRVTAKPADNERAFFTGASGEVVTRNFKDAAGRFELEGLKKGNWVITVRESGYGPSQGLTARVPEGPLTGKFDLARDARIRGRVVDADGNPVAKAEIECELQGRRRSMNFSSSADGEASTRTDADGRFELKRVAAGVVELTADSDAPEFVAAEALELEVAPASEVEDVVLTLRRAARVIAQVHPSLLDRADLEIHLNEQGGPIWRNQEPDEKGRSIFEALNPGTYTLTLEIPAKESESEDLPSDFMTSDRRQLELVLAEGESREVLIGEPSSVTYTVLGTVLRGGVPLEGASVQVETHQDNRSFRARTISGGSFSLSVESTGTVSLTVLVPGSKLSAKFQREIEPDSEQAFTLDIPTGGIRGVVFNSAGELSANCMVSLIVSKVEKVEGAPFYNMPVETDESGAFEFIGLVDGEYELEAAMQRQSWWGNDDDGGVADAPGRLLGVQVSAENEGPTNVELQLSEGATLKGIVTLVGGKSPHGYMVYRVSEDHQIDWTTVTRVTGGGTYELDGLPEGKVNIGVRASEGGQTEREVHIYRGQENVLDFSLE